MTNLASIVGAAVIALAATSHADAVYDDDDDDDDDDAATTESTEDANVTYTVSPMYSEDIVEPVTPDPYGYTWSEPRLLSQIGIGVNFGGGVAGFTGSAMRDLIENDIGGAWSVRGSFGTHVPLGVEIGYLGTASALETINGFNHGTLIGATFEAALRFNILPHFAWNPYVFAGGGWQRYDVMDENFALADLGMQASDDLIAFPMGVGLSYRDVSGLVFDVRGTFRATENEDLLRRPNAQRARLDTWEANASIGYEF